MNRLRACTLLVLLAGCTTPISPGIPGEYVTRVSWKDASLKVAGAPAAAPISRTPGAREYVLDPAEWNPWLAKTLAKDLADLGASESAAPEVTIALVDSELESQAAGQEFWADLTIEVRGPGVELTIHGRNWSGEGYTEAARRAAADALKQIVENEALRKACTR